MIESLRILVAIASYGMSGERYLARLLEEYRRLPFHVRVVVVSNIERSLPEGVQLRVGLPTRDPWSLPFAHKTVLAECANDFDLFIYSEDDTLITQRNIEAFVEVSKALPENEIPGFLRYENGPGGVRHCINMHGHFHWEPTSVCQRGPYTFASLTNEHSACYLLTRKQLQRAIDSGRYLVKPYRGKYDLACTASTDPYTACGFRKLICISRLEDFLVHHLPDKYTGPGFCASEQSFEKQLRALLALGPNGANLVSLLKTETDLPAAMYSKRYDEPARNDVLGQIPSSTRSILSIGSGWGKAEKWLKAKGFRIAAVPLDSVVGACLQDEGIELTYGNLVTARKKLEGRKFQCLYISNILHLTPDPERVLRDYAELLEANGVVVLITPNIATLKTKLYELLGRPGFRQLRTFSKGGVQFVSLRSVRRWFSAAGLRIERIQFATTPRFQKTLQLQPALMGPMLATEIIAFGRKSSSFSGLPSR